MLRYQARALVCRFIQFTLYDRRQLPPTRAGQLDVVHHHCRSAGNTHLNGNLQALFYRFFVQFGFHAAAEAAFFEVHAVGVAGEGGYRVVGAAPFALSVVEFVVHGPVLALVTGAAGGLGGGHGVLVLAQGEVEVDEADFAGVYVFFFQALAGFGEAGAGGALVVGEFTHHDFGVFWPNGGAVLVEEGREGFGVGGGYRQFVGGRGRRGGEEVQGGGHSDNHRHGGCNQQGLFAVFAGRRGGAGLFASFGFTHWGLLVMRSETGGRRFGVPGRTSGSSPRVPAHCPEFRQLFQ